VAETDMASKYVVHAPSNVREPWCSRCIVAGPEESHEKDEDRQSRHSSQTSQADPAQAQRGRITEGLWRHCGRGPIDRRPRLLLWSVQDRNLGREQQSAIP